MCNSYNYFVRISLLKWHYINTAIENTKQLCDLATITSANTIIE